MVCGLNRKKSFRKEVQKMTFETDAKKIKDGMTFFIGKEYYLKVGKYAIRLDLSQLSAPILFENFIKSHENEIETIFKPNGDALYKKEEK